MSHLVKQADEDAGGRRKRAWSGTFAEYWDLVVRAPAVARSAAARAHEAVLGAGATTRPDGRVRYAMFADALFGIDAAIEQVVAYLESAARGFEIRRRILLLVGPPGSGKSTLVNRLKRGIEEHAATEEGALYAIDGCPLHEEPLHQIPDAQRAAVREQLGVVVEGMLCPRCRYVLDTKFEGRASAMPVRRLELSVGTGVGFGSYVATAPHAVDPRVLIGTTDEGLLSHDRRRNAAEAFRYDGQFFAANRGVMEFVDPFKLDERFLDVLNVVSEERRVPTERFGSVDIDTVLIAHTNEAEYRRFLGSPETAALQDRFVVVRVPYTLEISAEEAIYRKMLAGAEFGRIAVEPLAWRIAATWAVLTRLAPSRLDPVTKARLYDGEGLPGYPFDTGERERRAAPDEGMNGISPRFVVDRLSAAAVAERGTCLDAGTVMRSLWEGITASPRLAAREREALVALFNASRDELDRLSQREIQRAATDDYLPRRRELVDNYLEAAAEWVRSGGTVGPAQAVTLNRLEDRLRLPMVERHRVRNALGQATDRAASERWLEAAVDAELLRPWPALADRIAADRSFLDRLGERLQQWFEYDQRCIESVLARASEQARARRLWGRASIRWPWT